MKLLPRLALVSLAIIFFVSSAGAQNSSAKPTEGVMRERIAAIFQETLKSGETTLAIKGQPPVTARTFVPPSEQHVEEIQHYGEDAIPILAEYLISSDGFEKYHAMRFLSAIGGKGIIEPLRRVALHDSSPSFRSSALLWLSTAPWDLAAPIIKEAAMSDISPEVRKEAGDILAKHK